MQLRLAAVLLALGASAAFAAGAEIGDISVSPSAPVPGTTVTITFEVRNPDKRPLPTGVVDVRIRGRSIGTITTPAMAAGDRRRVSGGVTLPNVEDKSVRLELVPHNGMPAAVQLTLTPQPAPSGSPSALTPRLATGGSPAARAPQARSREIAGPNFVGTLMARSREVAAPNFIGVRPIRSRELAGPNFVGTQPARSRDIAAPNFIGARPPQ